MPASSYIMSPPRRRRSRLAVTATAALLLAATSIARPASAQMLELTNLTNSAGADVDLSSLKNNPKQVQLLRSGLLQMTYDGKAATAADVANFETYYLFKIAELTYPPSGKETVETRRYDLKRKDLKQLNNGESTQSLELHTRLNVLLVKNLPKIAENPQVALNSRVNAMILLGYVDQIEPNFATATAAVPLPDSTKPLIDAFNNQNYPESLRIAALMGLARQSELQLNGQVRPGVVAEAAKVITSRKPLPGFSIEGHQWATKLALQMVIGLTKTGGELNRPETVKALYDILNSEQEPLFLRRDAALALGHLDTTVLGAGAGVKPSDIVKALGNFTLTLTRAGSARPDPTAPISLLKAEDVFSPPNDDKEGKKLFVDGVGYYLNCIATALGGRSNRGLKNVGGIDPKTLGYVNELLNNHIDPMLVALASPRAVARQMPIDLAQKGDKLSAWLQGNAMAAPQVPPAPATGGGK